MKSAKMIKNTEFSSSYAVKLIKIECMVPSYDDLNIGT